MTNETAQRCKDVLLNLQPMPTCIVEGGNGLLVCKPGSIELCPPAFCNREERVPKDGLGQVSLFYPGPFTLMESLKDLFYNIYKSRLLQIGDFCILNKPHF